jgi:hypothetical protein
MLYGGWRHLTQQQQQQEQIGCNFRLLAEGNLSTVSQAVQAAVARCVTNYSCKNAWLSDKKITAYPIIKKAGWVLLDTTATMTIRLDGISSGHTCVAVSVSAQVNKSDGESHVWMQAFVQKLRQTLDAVLRSWAIKVEPMK